MQERDQLLWQSPGIELGTACLEITGCALVCAAAIRSCGVVARRSDQPSQLSEAAKQLDATKWPAPIINLFIGMVTPEQLLSVAEGLDRVKSKGQVREANFYVAERALQSGFTDEALKRFELAAADCPKTFIENQPLILSSARCEQTADGTGALVGPCGKTCRSRHVSITEECRRLDRDQPKALEYL
ncbi:hypothetical protein BCCGELA001_24485 [Bradyrhizobium sp. CCGE-LA001]|nr:hypothetical protein BCCGELA001_24485 [Bradyrhizobium sp. CCGE-LA001]